MKKVLTDLDVLGTVSAPAITLNGDDLQDLLDAITASADADTVDGQHAADLLARANHTGTQPLGTITGTDVLAYLTGATFTGETGVGDGTDTAANELFIKRLLGGQVHEARLGLSSSEAAYLRFLKNGSEVSRIGADANGPFTTLGGSLSNVPIVAEGGTAGARYIKFYDGTMIQTVKDTVTPTWNAGGMNYYDVLPTYTWDQAFTGTPTAVFSLRTSSGGASHALSSYVANTANSTQIGAVVASAHTNSITSFIVDIVAIGEWA